MIDVETEQIARSMRAQAGTAITIIALSVVLRETGTIDLTLFALGFVLVMCVQRYRVASIVLDRASHRLN